MPSKEVTDKTERKNGSLSTLKETRTRERATRVLFNALDELFKQNFSTWLSSLTLAIIGKEGESSQGQQWTFAFEHKNDCAEGGHHRIELKAFHNGVSSIHELYFKLVADEEEGSIKIKIRKSGKGKPKTFNLIHLGEPDGDNIWVKEERASLRYGNRKLSQNVLEVWFPQPDQQRSTSLQIPIHLKWREQDGDLSEKLPGHWAQFSDDGLEVELPEIQVEGSEDGFTVDTGKGNDLENQISSWMQVGLSYLMYWVICNIYAANGTLREDDTIPRGFPELEKFKAKRPVNLEPAEVLESLNENKLFFPWHVIESACSALNAGKHVIFTGPPGCGKSKLATFLARKATGQEPLMATGSPAWTAGDLIGRYLPHRSGRGLVFREGFFLRAIGTNERSRWLIIDEFNRANIDACFGELFSVLAGDVVELPFEKSIESGDDVDGEEVTERPVRIIPEGDEAETEADYLVPGEFRLIGTMNDADRSGLNDLSFALMRRFAIIPIEPPNKAKIGEIIEGEIEKTIEELHLEKNAWNVNENGQELCKLDSIEQELKFLFAPSEKDREYLQGKTNQEFNGLITEGVVGVSVIGDIIHFVGEGLRAGIDHEQLRKPEALKEKVDSTRSLNKWAENLTLSYLALATVLQVFPQLEALGVGTERENDQLLAAIKHILAAFHTNYHPDDLLMLRVTKTEEGYALESDETIAKFLFRNLESRFPHHADHWRRSLNTWLSSE